MNSLHEPRSGKQQKNANVHTEIKVRLVITDFECSSDEITQILDICPTTTWMHGDPISKTIMVHKQNGWMIHSPTMPDGNFEEQVNALLSIVMPHKKAFENLPPGSEVELSCVIYAYEQRPIISFSSDTVGNLAEIGASIDIDYYDLNC